MYLTLKQELNHLSKSEYLSLRELSHIAKNLYNEGLYSVRQYFFNTGTYLQYSENYKVIKSSDNYKMLNSNMSQQILKEVDGAFKSFFALKKLKDKGEYDGKVKIPKYLNKEGFCTLIIGFVRLNNNELVIPYSNKFNKSHKKINIKIPTILADKKIKEIRLIPKSDATYFEVQYTYEAEPNFQFLDDSKALGIDLGINNLVTAVTNDGKSFIVDGRKLKSINQYYNKLNAKYQSIKDKQKYESQTNRQVMLTRKRNNRVNDYISKTAKLVINYCVDNNIGNLIIGKNLDFQKGSNIGTKNNQLFTNIPFGKLCDKLEYLCKMHGINFIKQEESYTSKASFFDNDTIPTYDPNNVISHQFSGRRIKRGLYQTSKGYKFNADVNGALNILKKSNVVDLSVLYSRGVVDTPLRIRVL